MRLDDLLLKLMDRGGPNERVPRRFAEDGGGFLSRSRVDSMARVEPSDFFTTAWGTRAVAKNLIDPSSIVGIAIAGHVPDLTVLRAVGESAGLRGMWTDVDETASLLHSGIHDLTPARIARLNARIDELVEEQARERRLIELEAEAAALRAQAAESTPATPARRRPSRS